MRQNAERNFSAQGYSLNFNKRFVHSFLETALREKGRFLFFLRLLALFMTQDHAYSDDSNYLCTNQTSS